MWLVPDLLPPQCFYSTASGCRDLSWSEHILVAYIDTLCLLGFYLTTFKPTGVWSDQVNLCISEWEPDSELKISFGLPSWCLTPWTNEWFPYSFNIHITSIHTNNSHGWSRAQGFIWYKMWSYMWGRGSIHSGAPGVAWIHSEVTAAVSKVLRGVRKEFSLLTWSAHHRRFPKFWHFTCQLHN